MQFFSFFKTLVGRKVIIELKNDVQIRGTLHSVDQYLNIKLSDIEVVEGEKYPQLFALNSCFIRGSVVRYIHLNKSDVDTQLLQDSTRRAFSAEDKQKAATAR
jgi:U6 snRNA-associated Sm-like protein LSm2